MSERENPYFRTQLLEQALESDMQTDEERLLLKKHHEILKLIQDDQIRAGEISQMIKSLSSDQSYEGLSIKKNLHSSLHSIRMRINNNFNKLDELEKSNVLQDVYTRENKKYMQKEIAKDREKSRAELEARYQRIIKEQEEKRQKILTLLEQKNQEAKQQAIATKQEETRQPKQKKHYKKVSTKNTFHIYYLIFVAVVIFLVLIFRPK